MWNLWRVEWEGAREGKITTNKGVKGASQREISGWSKGSREYPRRSKRGYKGKSKQGGLMGIAGVKSPKDNKRCGFENSVIRFRIFSGSAGLG